MRPRHHDIPVLTSCTQRSVTNTRHMEDQAPPDRIAHLVDSTFRDARAYITRQHPELIHSPDRRRVTYHGHRAEMWIDSDTQTVIVVAVSEGHHMDIYRTTLTEFFANSSRSEERRA